MITKDKIEQSYEVEPYSDDSFCFVDIYSKQLKNKTMDFKTAYNKVIDAYFKDEIEPYNGSFCFCGTLNNNDAHWKKSGSKYYSQREFIKMEYELLSTINIMTYNAGDMFYASGKWDIKDANGHTVDRGVVKQHPNYENALFEGMVAALNMLREIHIERGENVDEEIEFKKRVIPCVVNN